MRAFLRENWMWVLAPFVLFGALLLVAWLLSDEGGTPFEYALF